jgi:hypothetical protein
MFQHAACSTALWLFQFLMHQAAYDSNLGLAEVSTASQGKSRSTAHVT